MQQHDDTDYLEAERQVTVMLDCVEDAVKLQLQEDREEAAEIN